MSQFEADAAASEKESSLTAPEEPVAAQTQSSSDAAIEEDSGTGTAIALYNEPKSLIPTVSDSRKLLAEQIEEDISKLLTSASQSIEAAARSSAQPQGLSVNSHAPAAMVLPQVIAHLNKAGWVAYQTYRDRKTPIYLVIASPEYKLQQLQTVRDRFTEFLAYLDSCKRRRGRGLRKADRNRCQWLLSNTRAEALRVGVDIAKETGNGWEGFVDSVKARATVTARFDEWETTLRALLSGTTSDQAPTLSN